MTDNLDPIMLSKNVSRLEKQLSDKHKEIEYYKRNAQKAGQKRLREVYQMSQLIEAKKIAENEREKVIVELQKALDEVKTLQGFIPICSSCKKIRDDTGFWNQIENYIQKHSKAIFSHSMCPECSDNLYGNEKWYARMKKKKDNLK